MGVFIITEIRTHLCIVLYSLLTQTNKIHYSSASKTTHPGESFTCSVHSRYTLSSLILVTTKGSEQTWRQQAMQRRMTGQSQLKKA